jgi:hypothetical protein
MIKRGKPRITKTIGAVNTRLRSSSLSSVIKRR